MTDAELWAAWRLWLMVAAAVVLIAAGLLIAVLVIARRILADAGRALAAAEKIRHHTLPIWELQTTNEVAEQILDTVQAIEHKGEALVAVLHGQPANQS